MRNDLTAAFLAKMADTYRKPIQVLVFHFEEGDRYISDRDISISGQLYDGIVENWGSLQTVGAENAISSTVQFDITLWNGGTERFSDHFYSQDPVDVFVDAYQTFEGLGWADFAKIGEFVIQDPIRIVEASELLSLSLISSNMRYFAQVGSILTRELYPNALEADLNKSIDLIVGNAGRVQCLCANKPPVATLQGSIIRRTVDISVNENLYELGFSDNGTSYQYVQIDEEIIRYRARYNEYFVAIERGCFGTYATSHSDGSQVIQARVPVTYIIGQGSLKSISDVFVGGQSASQTYSWDLNSNPATITFQTQPTYVSNFNLITGTVYFDLIGNQNSADQAWRAIEDSNVSDSAVIHAGSPYHGTLAVIQRTSIPDRGEIVNVYLNITHYAKDAYVGDYVRVWVYGVGEIGRLARPSEYDVIDVGGDVDLDHPHIHADGGNHDHSKVDPSLSTANPSHPHGVAASLQTSLQSDNYSLIEEIYDISLPITGVKQFYFTFPQTQIPARVRAYKAYVTFTIIDSLGADWVNWVKIEMRSDSGGSWHTYHTLTDNEPGRSKTYQIIFPGGWDYTNHQYAGEDLGMRVTAELANGLFGRCRVKFENAFFDFDEIVDTTDGKITSVVASHVPDTVNRRVGDTVYTKDSTVPKKLNLM